MPAPDPPMTETPLEALIAKLEAATGPDRDVDWKITLVVSPAGFRYHDCPAYTASLDAAQALVPEGYAWHCGCEIDLTPFARVFGHDLHEEECAATPALALCIASLRARAALPREEG